MKIVGLTLARNEAWILRTTLDASLRWCDEIIVMNHSSTDATRAIAATAANETKRVKIIDWTDGEHWMEMDARQRSLEIGREHHATHIAIVDADEALTHNNLPVVRSWFETLKPGECLDVPMIAPWGSLDSYSASTSGVITLGFADASDLYWKPRGEEKYHYHARAPQGSGNHVRSTCEGGVFHLQYSSMKRLIWKHRHYMMSERIRWPKYLIEDINEKYHWWEKPPHGQTLMPVSEDWWGDYPRDWIRLDHEPWYAQECQRMIDKYGSERFEGLDLFGWTP